MSSFSKSTLISTGLAIFSMFFGAGNLIFAVNLGKEFQSQTGLALVGFLLTAVCLPVLGLIAILVFDGDYKEFFKQAGRIPGAVMCFCCIAIIGPLVAMPRIVTLSFHMFEPFFPSLSLFWFSVIFLLVTLALTITESRIIDLLGRFISPALLLCLVAIFIAGVFHADPAEPMSHTASYVLLKNLEYGYSTLDMVASIFFASIVISILRKSMPQNTNVHAIAKIGFWAGVIGAVVLALIYIGLAWLGATQADSADILNPAEVLKLVFFRVMGTNGAFVMCAAVLLACLSTIIALAAISAEYLEETIFSHKINYKIALVISLLITFALSNLGLSTIMELSGPIITLLYPALIALAVMNIVLKLTGIRLIKPVVAAALLLSIAVNHQQLSYVGQQVKQMVATLH